MRLARIAPLLISFVGTALAEDDRTGRAREELERELQNMVKLPSASVEVVFDGIDSSRYKLLEASFALDEQPIPFTAGTKLLYAGEVPPGRHTLSATLLYEAPAISYGSIKYKVPGKFIFHAHRGIFMRVRARIEVDDGAEPSKRLQLVGNAETDLRAKLEDGVLPPMERKEPEADKGAIRYEKKVASAEPETERDIVSADPPPKRRIRLPLASPRPAAVHPVAFKKETAADGRNSASMTVAARSGGENGEEKTGSAAQSSDGDARPPPEVAAPAPSAPPVPPPPAALPPDERIGTAGMALAGAALAPIALLLFALTRRRR